jgi:hypothetical protein
LKGGHAVVLLDLVEEVETCHVRLNPWQKFRKVTERLNHAVLATLRKEHRKIGNAGVERLIMA